MPSLHSFEGSKRYMNYVEKDHEYQELKLKSLVNIGQLGLDASKKVILWNFKQQVTKFEIIDTVTIHYNGHGKIKANESDKEKAGLWCCAEDEVVGIEDFIKIITQKALHNEG